MKIFLSKQINKIDKKNRVSVPSQYRAKINVNEFNGIVVYPSFRNKCIEACCISKIIETEKIISKLDPYSDERDAFETVLLGEAIQLPFDGEGRIIIPQHLLNYASISANVCFVGKGNIFEMWNPDSCQAHLEKSIELAYKNRAILKNPDLTNNL